MTEYQHRRIRLVFEPNRFASEQLIKVYEQLTPIESRPLSMLSPVVPSFEERANTRRGEQ